MYKIWLTTITLGLVIICSNVAWSQTTFMIKGKVTDNKNEPLIGVNILLGSTGVGTITDYDGNYSFTGSVKSGEYPLKFSYLGYSSQQSSVNINDNNTSLTVDMVLSDDAMKLDEVLVVGSTLTSSRRQLGNAVNSVNAKDIEKSGTGNVITALQGRVPGAKITQVSGDPAGGINVNLRGVNSISGGSDPLYVIDGIIVSNSSVAVTQTGNPSGEAQVGTPRLADINPNDIESFNIINGAAAAAIYGSLAANGVVLITTKRGALGKPKVTVGMSMNINELRKKVYISTYGKQFGFASLRLGNITGLNAAQKAANPSATFVSITRDGAVADLATNLVDVTRYDYQDNIFQAGIGTDDYVNVSGGSEKTKYFIGASYMNNQGIIKNTDFSRIGLRANIDQIINSWASVSVGLNLIRSNAKEVPTGNVFYSPINGINITNNIWDATARDANGNLKGLEPTRINPLSIIETFKMNQIVNRVMSNAKLSLFPINGLQVDFIVGCDAFSQLGNQYIPIYPYAGVNPAYYANGYASTVNNLSFIYNTDINITYNKKFGNFSSNTVMGYNYQNQRFDYTQSNGENLLPTVSTVVGSSNRQTTYDLKRRWVDGYFLQETFGYNNQLFLTLAGRLDNSVAFSVQNRNQFYSKGSLSYVLSESGFWKNSKMSNWWNGFKLRASFGESGGLNSIFPEDRITSLNSAPYLGKNTFVTNSKIGNNDIKVERTRELEGGMDLGFLKNKLNLSFSAYSQNVFDLIINRQLAASEGGTSKLDNLGKMTNNGYEVALNYNIIKNKSFNWNVYSAYSTNKNKIVSLGSPVVAISTVSGAPIFLIEGQPSSVFYGTYFARDANGNTIKNQWGLEQTEKGTAVNYKAGDAIPAGSYVLGGVLYTPKRDANGLPTGTALRKIIGNPNPDFTLSVGTNFTYKRFNFGFLIDGVYGADVFNADKRTRQGVGIGDYSEKELKGELPRGYIHSIYPVEEWRVESGSFTKLREISIGYTFPEKTIKGVSELSITLIGRNLYSFDNYSGYDPETNAGGVSDVLKGIDFGNVPVPKTFQFSVRASF